MQKNIPTSTEKKTCRSCGLLKDVASLKKVTSHSTGKTTVSWRCQICIAKKSFVNGKPVFNIK